MDPRVSVLLCKLPLLVLFEYCLLVVPPGDNPIGGNLLPPGVNKGGVIPGNLPFTPCCWLTLEMLGICRLCLLLELPLFIDDPLVATLLTSEMASLFDAAANSFNDTLEDSLVANDLSNGLSSKSNLDLCYYK